LKGKDCLGQLVQIHKLIRAKEEKIRELRARAVYRPNRLGYEGRGMSPGDRVSEMVASICAVEELLVADKLRLGRLEARTLEKIGALANDGDRQLLELRYVDRKRWEEIADIMGYSPVHVRGSLHNRALRAFEKSMEPMVKIVPLVLA
jgi:DNA-directed RNA polymerase specialized sigma24 family protein